jgi:hypothetical protein
MKPSNPNHTSIVPYRPTEDVTRHIHDQVREKLANLPLVPVPYRTPVERILGLNNTLLDRAEYFRQHAEHDRTFAVAVRARGDLAMAIAELAEIPHRVARSHQRQAKEHDAALLKLEYEERSYESAISDLELNIAKNRAAKRRLEAEPSQGPWSRPANLGPTAKEQVFADKMSAERGIRAQLALVIADINAMDISDTEKKERITAAEQTARELLQGAE